MKHEKASLLFCIVMDIIGCLTYAVPGVGEFADVVWAPVSAIIFYKTFGGWKGALGSIFSQIADAFDIG